MRRIAYVTADRGIPVFGEKGASIHIREMINAFSQNGDDVTLFAGRIGANHVTLDANLVKVRANGGLSAIAQDLEGTGRQQAKEEYALLLSDAAIEAICAEHRRARFDFIYERYGLFSTAGVGAAKMLGIPCFLEVNSPLVLEQQKYRQLSNYKAAKRVEFVQFSQADVIGCVSNEVAEYVLANGGRCDQVLVIPNAVDTFKFTPDIEPRVLTEAASRTVIGFSGSLKPWHGVDVLMRAFAALLQKGNPVHLLIIGDGPLRPWIEGFAAGADISQHVTITGWVQHEDLPSWLTAVDIAVAPYPRVENFYFSPLKLAEYMAAGRCVVASDIGQITQLIADGVNGRLVVPGDIDHLVYSIERLRALPGEREKLGQHARSAACGRTWQVTAERVTDLCTPDNSQRKVPEC